MNKILLADNQQIANHVPFRVDLTRLAPWGREWNRSALTCCGGEQILIVVGGELSQEAREYRDQALDLFLPPTSPQNKWRRKILERLFNGDWRIAGQVLHLEVGCCRSPA